MSNGETYVGDMIELAYGRSLSADNRKDGPVPVYGSNGIVGYHNDSAVDGPGIVVGRKGSVGALAFSDGPFWPIDTTYFVVNKGAHDWRFLYHFLRSLGLTGLNSHSAVPGLNREDVYSICVRLPARAEGAIIGQVLDQIEGAVAREDAAIVSHQTLKRAVMRELFTRGLQGEEQKESEFGAVPASWAITDLDNHAQVQTGAAKGRKFGDADTVEVPYLRVANVQDGHLDLREMKTIQIRRSEVERYRLHDGDVVLTEGGDFDKLGRGFIWRSELDLCVHQNHVFAVRPDPTVLIPEFFAYLAQSAYGKAYFLKVAHKTTNLACINSAKLKAFPVLIPPTLQEQREIADIFHAIDAKIDLHKRKKAVLEELFRALLHKLMTGEIRVADLDLSALQAHQEVAA
ncbi:restriction endonuclease subunit S [Novosphingobium sp. FSW06-99]|uniref:restriction endonuclease subunit S n=1 Tax=Novosphingobium sp. FSW06-99 TaxID=1739113 RepID=UPI0009E92AC7|nr:restriction endonuclease subunit S [Novosphingobium sp. FSW06-99]